MIVIESKKVSQVWPQHALSRWLPLSLGLAMGTLLAYLIANEAVFSSFLLMFAAPCILLLIRYPFAAIMTWLLLFPYFVSPDIPGVSIMHWVLHRLLMPSTLGFVCISRWLGMENRKSIHPGYPELAMLVFLAGCLVNIWLWSEEPIRAATNICAILCVLADKVDSSW
jgi:hypothetical protein